MAKILTVEQMRALEAAADAAGTTYEQMMERAGRAVAELIKALVVGSMGQEIRVAILCGKGNNGGDGLVAAQALVGTLNISLSVFLVQERPADDPKVTALREAGVLVADTAFDAPQGYRVLRTMVANADILVDAILGTGAELPLKGDLEKEMRQIHKALEDRKKDRPPVAFRNLFSQFAEVTIRFGEVYSGIKDRPLIVAVDLPTGLDADTGALDKNAFHADHTITFEGAKPGLLMFPGAEAVGELHIAPLDLPEKVQPKDHKLNLAEPSVVAPLLPKRSDSDSKQGHGKAMVVGGSINYTGAPALAAMAAYRVGAGLVTIATPQVLMSIIGAHVLEATWLPLPHENGALNEAAARELRAGLDGYTALVLGPGIGHEPPTAAMLDALLSADGRGAKGRTIGFALPASGAASKESKPLAPLPPMVIDADALNLLAKMDKWHERLSARSVLTPHAGEMARLCGFVDDEQSSAWEKVQADRWKLAREKAAEWNQIVVLKGAFTVVADPDGRCVVSPFATSALAKAGTGDVLSGVIGGLIAQKVDPFDAAVAGVYLHGAAGRKQAQIWGNSGVLASSISNSLHDVIIELDHEVQS